MQTAAMRGLLITTLASCACALHMPACANRLPVQKNLRAPAAMMAQWTSADMSAKRLPLPAELDEKLSDDTDRDTTAALWAALRSCFDTEEEAMAAAMRNTGTILPYLNSPSNIYGCYQFLEDGLGREGARDVCAKNPGILQCNPKILAREDLDKIVSAADQVDWFESGVLGALPPAVRQNLDKIAFLVLALPVAKRLSDCAGATCG